MISYGIANRVGQMVQYGVEHSAALVSCGIYGCVMVRDVM